MLINTRFHRPHGMSLNKHIYTVVKRLNSFLVRYIPGLGNCGGYSKYSDMIVALPTSVYAGGKYCGKVRVFWVPYISGQLTPGLFLENQDHQYQERQDDLC